ncbi:hypothetical protein ACSAZL_10025 [Methanosarcina sp. T3]
MCLPEVIRKNLDGNPETEIEKGILACSGGLIILICAYGDNRERLEK